MRGNSQKIVSVGTRAVILLRAFAGNVKIHILKAAKDLICIVLYTICMTKFEY